MQELRIPVGNVTLQIQEYEHTGDAVLFLHYGGANLMMWQGVIPHFQERYRLILVDLRGHGKSDKPQTGYHIDELARDVAEMLAQLNLAGVHVIGSSLGAEVGLSLAANYPHLVRTLVCEGALYSEYGPYSPWEGTEAEFKDYVADIQDRMRTHVPPTYPSVEALVEENRRDLEEQGCWNSYFEALIRYDIYQVAEGQYTRSWPLHVIENYLEHYFSYRFEDYYKRVRCPVLLMPGEPDAQDELHMQILTDLCTLMPQGQIGIVPGWSHPYGWLLTPAEGSRTVLEFLANR